MKIKNPKARLASLDSLAAFFRHVEISGSHEASLTYVIEGRADIADAIGGLMAAIEVIDLRAPEGISEEERALMGVAGDIWNAGIVLGPKITDW